MSRCICAYSQENFKNKREATRPQFSRGKKMAVLEAQCWPTTGFPDFLCHLLDLLQPPLKDQLLFYSPGAVRNFNDYEVVTIWWSYRQLSNLFWPTLKQFKSPCFIPLGSSTWTGQFTSGVKWSFISCHNNPPIWNPTIRFKTKRLPWMGGKLN